MKRIGSLNSLIAGISNSRKNGPPHSFAFARNIDFRYEPTEVTVNSKSVKISGSTVTDLPMWMDVAGNNLYGYGNVGNVYKISTSDVVTKEYTISNSQGNGMAYLPEDKYLYLAGNVTLNRRSTADTTGTYYESFLENEGGAPTNTKSLNLVAASSMSATRADTASLSITGDITLEACVKPTSMPTTGNQMTLISKWDESGAKRSYKLGFVPTSATFGDGSDGALTISADTTESPIDSACTGTIDTNTLSATNASFAAGQKVLIHQSQGSGSGTYQLNEIQSYTAGTITLTNNLNATYISGAQVRVLKQYTNVTINSGKTYTAKAWNGTVGGIIGFYANGTVTITGNITASNKGFVGASGSGAPAGSGGQGEGTGGAPNAQSINPNGNGGGGGLSGVTNYGAVAGGGGGGNGTAGQSGETLHGKTGGTGGSISSAADLSTMTFGGGGGAGGSEDGLNFGGGIGGGIVCVFGATVATITGTVTADGQERASLSGLTDDGMPGGGAGGSIYFKAQTIDVGTSKVTASGGSGAITTGTSESDGGGAGGYGGNGGSGVIHIDYATSYTGTTTPSLNVTNDTSLNASGGYALRLYISSTGNNSETYTQNIDSPIGQWNRFSVAWDASASTAYFYRNRTLFGTRVGALTAIHDNASIFGIGTYVDSGSANTGFLDGLIDEARVWNTLRSESEIANNNSVVLTGSETGLVAYYQFENDVTDSQTSGLNDLTANNTPTYSSDVPFSGVTTRGDQDVAIDGSGQTYTLTTGINEGATHKQTFTPTKEPLKSIALNIDTIGTGNWTVVVHDELNRTLASVTVANASLLTGVYEFIFASSVRPVLGASYHVHVYSTVADGKVVTSVASDLETAYLRTYFQILVSDQYHPISRFINFLVIGNERYIAKLEAGSLYEPHRLILPSGYRVRCFAPWNDYIAIATWQGTDVADIDSAKIFFWDGTSDTYIEPLDVPQGAINALFGKQGRLYISAGYRGNFYEYIGGTEAKPLFRTPEVVKTDKVEYAPASMTMWQGLVCIGGPFATDSSTVHQGIYTYGALDSGDPYSLGFDYPLSIGDIQSSMVSIGSLMARGKKLYIGHGNSGVYAIDMVDPDAVPYNTATIELLISDLNNLSEVTYPLTFRVDFLPLVTGQSITLKYKPDRATSWRTIKTQSTVGATEMSGTINQRVKEVQFAVDITTNGSQVTITNFAFDTNDTKEIGNIQYAR